ncbi:MAG: ribose-5-phosphate isomerase RpiA [Gammaproteobacteria bacterium]
MDAQKRAAAIAAIEIAKQHSVIGVGTGSTVNYFIEELAKIKGNIDTVVASSEDTAKRLKEQGFHVADLNYVGEVPIYIDGADKIDPRKQMIKGGGAALTREKILAKSAKQFVCIVDETKEIDVLGEFPVAVEVVPMARGYVARQIVKLNADPVYRENVVTDNGNIILDVHNLDLTDALNVENTLNQITGVVENGVFASRRADTVLVATSNGVVTK